MWYNKEVYWIKMHFAFENTEIYEIKEADMSLLEAIFMGIVQGLTEFLPVSSSGHLAMFKILFGIETETGMLFDVLLHFGTLVAICMVFYKDVAKLIVEGIYILKNGLINLAIWVRNSFIRIKNMFQKDKLPEEELDLGKYHSVANSSYRKFVLLVIMSTIPTGIIGIIGKDMVEMASRILIVLGICLVITAILLFVADAAKGGEKLPKDISYSNAFIIGIVQGVATLPGISRSGSTITACLLSGFNRSFAVKYSFIMSIPAILGAMLLELKDFSVAALSMGEIVYYIIGMVIAGVVGYVCIKTMLVIVRNKKFKIFGIYCLIIGMISIIGHFYIV